MSAFIVAGREYASLFRIPLGWVVMALLTALSGLVVALAVLEPGAIASMRAFFVVAVHLLLPVAPAISMRLISEEARTGTLESLLASPVGSFELALGKLVGGWAFLITCLSPTVLMAAALWIAADPVPDPGPLVAGYLTLGSLAAAYLGVGLAVSATTDSQTLSFLATFMILLGLIIATTVGPGIAPAPVDAWLTSLSLTARLSDAGKGVIDLAHLAYFWGIAAVSTAAAATLIEARRCP